MQILRMWVSIGYVIFKFLGEVSADLFNVFVELLRKLCIIPNFSFTINFTDLIVQYLFIVYELYSFVMIKKDNLEENFPRANLPPTTLDLRA